MRYIVFFLMLCSCVSRDTIGPYVMRIQKDGNGDLEQKRCLIYVEYGAFSSISLHEGPCTREPIK